MDTRRDDLAAFGLQAADAEEGDIEIWPENLETVSVFLACSTQWDRNPMSGKRRGLRYADLAATVDMMDVNDRREVFDGVRTMENEALATWAQ